MKTRLARLAAAAVLASGVSVVGPPAAAENEVLVYPCDIVDGYLEWGFKESFRSYITGVGDGVWQLDGADYVSPDFVWSEPAGLFDPAYHEGFAAFEGSVRFYGHEGVLDFTISDPRLVFVNRLEGYLSVDVRGTARDGGTMELADVRFVDLDFSAGDTTFTDDHLTTTIAGIPTTLTDDGANAFPTYISGESFDSVSVEFVTECDWDRREVAASGQSADGDDPNWLVIGLGSLSVVALAAAGVLFWRGRRQTSA